jgi:hypothetical protein
LTNEQGVQVAINPNTEVLTQGVLDAWIKQNLEKDVISRQMATTITPVSNNKYVPVTGVHEVLLADETTTFQCIYCGIGDFPTAISGRAHLASHGDRKDERADRAAIAGAAANGTSIYAPYATDDENVTFMLRVMDENGPATRRIQRLARQGGKKAGQSTVPTEELTTLKAKAKAYDTLKAQTLKSQFPV